METIHGLSNWRLAVRREAGHAVILRAVTCDRRAVLPDMLWGLPVTVLGDRALAPGAAPLAGQEVRVLCGREGDEWSNRNLEELTLPRHLAQVGDYALYGCRSLGALRLHDGVKHWGGGCLMNCRALNTVFLTRVGERQGEALAFLCGELHHELDVTIREADGALTRLIFPEFAEAYEENCPAHHFDYKIYGGGHPYHHVFRDRQLSLRAYDGLWDRYLREEHEPDAAMRLAFTRLRWPTGLTEQAERQYWDYLSRCKEQVLLWRLSQGDSRGLTLLLDGLEPGPALLRKACDQARSARNTEALALLLERRRRARQTGLDKAFDL